MRGVVEVVLGFVGMAGVFVFYLLVLLVAGWVVTWLVRFVPLVGRRGRKGPRDARSPTSER